VYYDPHKRHLAQKRRGLYIHESGFIVGGGKMRLPLWLDVDWEYEDGEIHVKSVNVYGYEILDNLTRYELDKIKAEIGRAHV
jgi:hypothetical protein